ncbi:MAG: DALR anticodon-binding domain-containing protein, partial [Gammaproteobacteria bacterium]|nr:DALR anticodon-binding domain-containing protein [Gammaproteobacteria bacterium]
ASQSNDNPVYYVQYAHARICSVFRQLEEQSIKFSQSEGLANLNMLDKDSEKSLINRISKFPELIVSAAQNLETHLLAHYLRDLANDFHTYYNAEKFIQDDAQLTNARLCLILAVKQVISNGLGLLAVSAPEKM